MATQTVEEMTAGLFHDVAVPTIHIGMATCGLAAGARSIEELVIKEIEKRGIEARIIPTGCIGMCHNEPLVDITMPGMYRVSYRNVKASIIPQIFEAHFVKGEFAKKSAVCQIPVAGSKAYEGLPLMAETGFFKGQVKIVSSRCGLIDPSSIDDYIATDGYRALRKMLTEMTPEMVIDEMTKSGLRGRGGGWLPHWSQVEADPSVAG